MKYKNLKIYKSDNKKYALIRIMSGIISPILLLTTLSSCGYQKYTGENKHYNEYVDKAPNDYYQEETTTNYQGDSFNSNNDNNNNNNLSLELDDYLLSIVNSDISFDDSSLNSFINYINGISVEYPYSDLFGNKQLLNKYYSLGSYKSTAQNLFENKKITADTIYSIVKRNNQNADLVEVEKMSDSDLRYICSVIADVLNDYVKNNSNVDLNLLSEKISELKILNFSGFSNGYYDSTKDELGFSVDYIKNKEDNFYKKTIEHETYHFIQSNSVKEATKLNFESRNGFSYKFNGLPINSLDWNWYYEGSAEYLTCNLNNTKESLVYNDVIKSMDTIKVATLLSNNNAVNEFENLSLSNDLNDLFNYFGCKNDSDKLEILNLMYAHTIIYNLNSCCDDFFNKYEETYGVLADKRLMERELNNGIGKTLTKQFYRNLSNLIKNKEVSVEEIFSLISIFENEISREVWYNSYYQELSSFISMYTDVQTYFFGVIANKLGVSVEDVQQAYNSYNKVIIVDVDNISIIDSNKKEFYDYIVETRVDDKMNSINYVGEKNNIGKQR